MSSHAIAFSSFTIEKLKKKRDIRFVCRALDLFGSQMPVTAGAFELRIYCI